MSSTNVKCIWLSLLAVALISIYSAYISWGKYTPCFDASTAIIGVLSILVTILIGWQIHNLIKIGELRDEISNKTKEIDLIIKNKSEELKKQNEQSLTNIAKRNDKEIRNLLRMNRASKLGIEADAVECFDICSQSTDAHITQNDALDTIIAIFENLSLTENLHVKESVLASIIDQIDYEQINKVYQKFALNKNRHNGVNTIFTELLRRAK